MSWSRYWRTVRRFLFFSLTALSFITIAYVVGAVVVILLKKLL